MKIIVRYNTYEKVYHAYIPLVNYSADIPEEVYSANEILDLIKTYTKDTISVDVREPLDITHVTPLVVDNVDIKTGLDVLTYLRYLMLEDYPIVEYPYLTVALVNGKIWIHKDMPIRDSWESTWDSEVQEPIGYLPISLVTDEEDILYDTVFKCKKLLT